MKWKMKNGGMMIRKKEKKIKQKDRWRRNLGAEDECRRKKE